MQIFTHKNSYDLGQGGSRGSCNYVCMIIYIYIYILVNGILDCKCSCVKKSMFFSQRNLYFCCDICMCSRLAPVFAVKVRVVLVSKW